MSGGIGNGGAGSVGGDAGSLCCDAGNGGAESSCVKHAEKMNDVSSIYK